LKIAAEVVDRYGLIHVIAMGRQSAPESEPVSDASMWDWITEHKGLIFVVSAVMFVGSLIALPFLIARMPEDYFLRRRSEALPFSRAHPAVRVVLLVLKNLLGAAFLLAGVVMIFTPGQGILAVLLGVSLLDIPGKRRLELAIVRRPHVLKAINWIREKAERPPLRLPAPRLPKPG
jgi:hypothetical protein